MRRLSSLLLLLALTAFPSVSRAHTTGGIRGFVFRNVPGVPWREVAVAVDSPATGTVTVYTDSHGFFAILGLPPGRYTIRAAPDLLLYGQSAVPCVPAGIVEDVKLVPIFALATPTGQPRLMNPTPDPSRPSDLTSIMDNCTR